MSLRQRVSSLSDRTLNHVLTAAVALLVAGVVAFGGFYYADQHVSKGPSLVSRQISSAEHAVRAAPGSIPARLQLAAAYRLAKRYDDALEQYGQVLKAEPENHGALLGRGNTLIDKGDLDAARATFTKIVKTASGGEFAGADTQLEQAYYYLGSIALKQGRAKEAATRLQSALRIDRTDADAWYLLGSAKLQEGAAPAAITAIRRALLFVPSGWCDPYATLGNAYRTQGRTAQAQWADAMVDFCTKRPDDARRQLTALTTGPAAVDAMFGLGMIAQQAGDRSTAIGWYQKVVARDPNNAGALYALSWLGADNRPGKKAPTAGHPTPGQGKK
jgi:tetratricopeptide (TPR) repeat protein